VVGEAQWRVPVPVDRGRHVVTATAAGKVRWEKAVEIHENGVTVDVVVERLRDAVVKRPGGPGSPPPAPSFWTVPRIAGVSLGGLGVVAVGVGAFFGAQAIANKNDSEDGGYCTVTGRCDDKGLSLREDGLASGRVSTVLFIAGGAGVAAGTALFLTAPYFAKKTTVAVAPGMIGLSGAF
jgi:hypothetical protein